MSDEEETDTRIRRLELVVWLLFLAVPVGCTVVLVGVFGLRFWPVFAGAVVVAVLWWRVNRRVAVTVGSNPRQSRLRLLRWRIVAAAALGLVVGTAVVVTRFHGEVDRESARPRVWDADHAVLVDEQQRHTAVVTAPPPRVGDDPDVQRLQSRLDQANADLPAVQRNVECEADGTCGSRRYGKGGVYAEKAAYRDYLKRLISTLPAAIEKQKDEVRQRFADQRASAERELARIARQLGELGERPRETNGLVTWMRVLGRHDWAIAGMYAPGMSVVLLELVVLLGVVAVVCRGKAESADLGAAVAADDRWRREVDDRQQQLAREEDERRRREEERTRREEEQGGDEDAGS